MWFNHFLNFPDDHKICYLKIFIQEVLPNITVDHRKRAVYDGQKSGLQRQSADPK